MLIKKKTCNACRVKPLAHTHAYDNTCCPRLSGPAGADDAAPAEQEDIQQASSSTRWTRRRRSRNRNRNRKDKDHGDGGDGDGDGNDVEGRGLVAVRGCVA